MIRWTVINLALFHAVSTGRSGPAVLIGVLFAVAEAKHLRLAVLSRAWPSVPGQIAETAIREREGWSIGWGGNREGWSIGWSRSPWQDVLYRYKIGEKYYVGTRKSFTGVLQDLWRPRSYEAGADVVVRHHPTKPELAVLEPGVPLELTADYVVFAALVIVGSWRWLAG